MREIKTNQSVCENYDSSGLFHIKETISMLYLAIAQIDISILEGDKSINDLTVSFVDLVKDIKEILQDFSNSLVKEDHEVVRNEIAKLSDDICNKVRSSVIAFQFYDRLSQRLDHVCQSLKEISELIKNESIRENPDSWLRLQQFVRSKYTMEAERKMFDSLLVDGNLDTALKQYQQNMNSNNDEDDNVELF